MLGSGRFIPDMPALAFDETVTIRDGPLGSTVLVREQKWRSRARLGGDQG
jgi:hypothetical protein